MDDYRRGNRTQRQVKAKHEPRESTTSSLTLKKKKPMCCSGLGEMVTDFGQDWVKAKIATRDGCVFQAQTTASLSRATG